IMGQMLTKFRTWMFGLAETRMGAMKYAPDLGAYEIGRFRVGFGDVAHGFRINLKETTKLLLSVASMGLYSKKGVNQDTVDRMYLKFMQENPDHEGRLTKEQFI